MLTKAVQEETKEEGGGRGPQRALRLARARTKTAVFAFVLAFAMAALLKDVGSQKAQVRASRVGPTD